MALCSSKERDLTTDNFGKLRRNVSLAPAFVCHACATSYDRQEGNHDYLR